MRQVHQARSNKRKIETRLLANHEKLLLGTFTLNGTSLEAFAENELGWSSRGRSGEPEVDKKVDIKSELPVWSFEKPSQKGPLDGQGLWGIDFQRNLGRICDEGPLF